jgi:hypothetical protein
MKRNIQNSRSVLENSKMVSQQLSKNFNLYEFIISQSVGRFEYDNMLNEEIIENLKELCIHILQLLREILRVPVIISFGYHYILANAAIGGDYRSQHFKGMPADFLTPSCHLSASFHAIYKNLPFGQLIFEFGR